MRILGFASGLVVTAVVMTLFSSAPAAACDDEHEPPASLAVLDRGERVLDNVAAAGQLYAGIPAAMAAPEPLTAAAAAAPAAPAAPAPTAHPPRAAVHSRLNWAGVYGGGLLLLGVMLVVFLPLGRRRR